VYRFFLIKALPKNNDRDQLPLSVNHALKNSEDLDVLKGNCKVDKQFKKKECSNSKNIFGRMCLQTGFLDLFCMCKNEA
jgi:hypothetical protein